MPADYVPVLVAVAFAFLLGGALLIVSRLAGSRSGGLVKLSPYESGEPLLDHSRKRISIAFFLIAIDFVVFDVEVAYLAPWVLVLREGGWSLYVAGLVFVALILVGYAYLWRKGGLDLDPRREGPG